MKTGVKIAVVIALLAVLTGLILSGTIDLQSAFGVSEEKFDQVREMLLAEDFGIGVSLGEDYEDTVEYLGTPMSTSSSGVSKSATYSLPLGKRAGTTSEAPGIAVITAEKNIVTSVTLNISNWSEESGHGGPTFDGTGIEDLTPDDLIRVLGRPAARFVVLGNKVFTWYLLPPVKTEKGMKIHLGGTISVTARFSKASGQLRSLRVKTSRRFRSETS